MLNDIHKNTSIFYMLISVLSITASGFFAKLAMQSVSLYLVLVVRFFIPFIILVFFLISTSGYKIVSLNNMGLHLTRAISLTASQFLLFYSMQQLSMGEATVLYNTGPIFIIIFSFILGYEILAQSIVGVILGALGVLLICHLQYFMVNQYIIAGILSGVAFAISQLTLHSASKKEDNLTIMVNLYFLTSIFSAVLWILLDKKPFHAIHIYSSVNFYLIMLGLTSLSNQFFRGLAYKNSQNPASLMPLLYLSVGGSIMLDLIVFYTVPNAQSLIGSGFIIMGSIIASYKKRIVLNKFSVFFKTIPKASDI